jgi:hypothetical protein
MKGGGGFLGVTIVGLGCAHRKSQGRTNNAADQSEGVVALATSSNLLPASIIVVVVLLLFRKTAAIHVRESGNNPIGIH